MKQHTYTKDSWQNVTDEIKKHFGWKCLTSLQASAIMKMYLSRVSVEEMIKQLEDGK